MLKKKLSIKGPVFIVIAAMLWALDGVFRRSLYSLSPLVIVFLEHAVGTLLIFPFLLRGWKEIRSLTKKELAVLGGISLLSSLLGTLWFTTALLKTNFIPFSVVFLLQKVQPVFVIFTAWLVLKERITKQYLLWAGMALVAAYFVTFPGGIVSFATGTGTLEAALYALAAAFAWGSSTVFSKIALETKSDTVVTGLRFFITSILAGAAVVVFGQSQVLSTVTLPQIGMFVVIALSTGMVALSLYYKGLAVTEAKVSTILELVFPVSAVLLDIIVYKSVLAPSQYLAAVVLLFAAFRLTKLREKGVVFTSKKIKGKGRGKKMGFPTINLAIPKMLSIEDGIYAVCVKIGSASYKGAMHFGPIPAFGETHKSLEVYLLDTKNLPNSKVVGKSIEVEVVRRIRPVMNFGSPVLLADQISLDVRHAEAILR
ncbi:EamA family transporter [Candidatus Gottesmanbacteria bacterium]|nr:EamA family transporter [Candidatus Gottesmanbacteria bacterium]